MSTMKREYSIQYFQNADWIRISGIYENPDEIRTIIADMAFDGLITRIVARNYSHDFWSTVQISSSQQIVLGDTIHSCPR